MTKARVVLSVLAIAIAAPLWAAPPAVGERLSFVSCPVVRDTPSVPCWLSEYAGSTYYLTIQSDVSAAVQPPMLGHQVLVEGIVSSAPAICAGIVLEQVHLSVMPELDANCNTRLPADERYRIDFNPRPPGPSGGRLAFEAAPLTASASPTPPTPTSATTMTTTTSAVAAATITAAPASPLSIQLYFDFDKSVSFRHPAALVAIVDQATQLQATRMQVTGIRGAHRLSDGSLLQETATIGQRRAEEVARLLQGAGVTATTTVHWIDGVLDADGIDDWQSRGVVVELLP
jgi:outer membrane protein OmpA-like peptidoglycan-associated protein